MTKEQNPMDLNAEDIKNILALIDRVQNITGAEALAVAITQKKLRDLLPPEEPKVEEVPKEKLEETIGKPTE